MTVRVAASPLARRLASERGLDLAEMKGSGPGGRVVAADLERRVGATETGPFGTAHAIILRVTVPADAVAAHEVARDVSRRDLLEALIQDAAPPTRRPVQVIDLSSYGIESLDPPVPAGQDAALGVGESHDARVTLTLSVAPGAIGTEDAAAFLGRIAGLLGDPA